MDLCRRDSNPGNILIMELDELENTNTQQVHCKLSLHKILYNWTVFLLLILFSQLDI